MKDAERESSGEVSVTESDDSGDAHWADKIKCVFIVLSFWVLVVSLFL